MISKAKKVDLNNIIKLHLQVLGNTSSSKFGFEFVKNLYSQIIKDRNASLWIDRYNNEIVGFLCLTSKIKSTTTKIKKSFNISHIFNIIYTFLSEPRELIVFLKRLNFDNNLIQKYGDYPTILTIGTSSIYRGLGIGSKLIKTSDTFFRKKGYRYYFVDTESKNKIARLFYRKNNFIEIENFSNNVLLRKNL